jgi:hypothetical protein
MLNRRCKIAYGKNHPHYVVAGDIYYHLEVCNNLLNYKWANNIINNAAPPIC